MTSTKERNLNHAHAHTSISIHTHIVRYYIAVLQNPLQLKFYLPKKKNEKETTMMENCFRTGHEKQEIVSV